MKEAEIGNEMSSFSLITALTVFQNDCSNEKQEVKLFLCFCFTFADEFAELFSVSVELSRREWLSGLAMSPHSKKVESDS